MADDESRPAVYVHRRRVPRADKQKRMASSLDFLWCTYANSKHLNANVLPYLLPHLEITAAKYRMVMAPEDVEWLTAHNGRFMHFIHPQSKEYRLILKRKKFLGKTHAFVKEDVLQTRHSVIGVSPRFKGKDLSPNYFDNQEKWLGMLWNFLAIIGDYESMLILLVAPPPNCPSVNFASTQGFILHKFNVPLSPLCYSWEGGDPIHDRNLVPILSEGAVDNFNWISTLIAALNCLHPKRAKGGDSQEHTITCPACYAMYFLQSAPGIPLNDRVSHYKPCQAHTDSHCQYCNRGNPYYKSSKSLIDLMTYLKAETKRRLYKETPVDGLLRSDVLDIHAYVKACHYKTWDFANYTMCLGGIYYAGRFDSYSEASLEDFSNAHEHFSIHNNFIEHLAQQVFGKSDKHWHTYLLKFQDHCPELCYLRHLLVFVHCMNLLGAEDSTHLFPDKATLMAHTPSSSVESYTGDASYLEGLDWLKKRVKENVTNPVMLFVGMHSLRITFYLWAVLCNTPRPIYKKNARHKSDDMVAKYEGNANAVKSALLKNPEQYAKQRIGPPQEDLIITGEANQAIRVNLMGGSSNSVEHLPEAAKLFVENMLHVPSTHSRYKDPAYLLELSYGMTFTGQPPGNQHLSSVVQSLPTQYQNKVAGAMSVFQSLPTEYRNIVAGALNLHTSQQPTHMTPEVATPGTPSQPAVINPTTGQSTVMNPTTGLPPAVSIPISIPKVLQLIPSSSSSSSRKYHLPLHKHKFGSKNSKEQCFFLYHVVQDLLSLGRNVFTTAPLHSQEGPMPHGPDPNHHAAQLYLRGKSLVPQKSSLSRLVDPFFECFQSCCQGDIALFQSKHPKFKASIFKKEQQCDQCKGLLVGHQR
jgi:hypothetical protein